MSGIDGEIGSPGRVGWRLYRALTANKVVLSLDISYHALMTAERQLSDPEWIKLAHHLRSEAERILRLPEEPEPIIDATCVEGEPEALPPPARELPSGDGGKSLTT